MAFNIASGIAGAVTAPALTVDDTAPDTSDNGGGGQAANAAPPVPSDPSARSRMTTPHATLSRTFAVLSAVGGGAGSMRTDNGPVFAKAYYLTRSGGRGQWHLPVEMSAIATGADPARTVACWGTCVRADDAGVFPAGARLRVRPIFPPIGSGQYGLVLRASVSIEAASDGTPVPDMDGGGGGGRAAPFVIKLHDPFDPDTNTLEPDVAHEVSLGVTVGRLGGHTGLLPVLGVGTLALEGINKPVVLTLHPYISAETLATARGPVDRVRRLNHFIHQLLSTLGYMHDHLRVIHEDLRCANVLTCRNCSRVYVIDYGFVQSRDLPPSRAVARAIVPDSDRMEAKKYGGAMYEARFCAPQSDIYAVGLHIVDRALGDKDARVWFDNADGILNTRWIERRFSLFLNETPAHLLPVARALARVALLCLREPADVTALGLRALLQPVETRSAPPLPISCATARAVAATASRVGGYNPGIFIVAPGCVFVAAPRRDDGASANAEVAARTPPVVVLQRLERAVADAQTSVPALAPRRPEDWMHAALAGDTLPASAPPCVCTHLTKEVRASVATVMAPGYACTRHVGTQRAVFLHIVAMRMAFSMFDALARSPWGATADPSTAAMRQRMRHAINAVTEAFTLRYGRTDYALRHLTDIDMLNMPEKRANRIYLNFSDGNGNAYVGALPYMLAGIEPAAFLHARALWHTARTWPGPVPPGGLGPLGADTVAGVCLFCGGDAATRPTPVRAEAALPALVAAPPPSRVPGQGTVAQGAAAGRDAAAHGGPAEANPAVVTPPVHASAVRAPDSDGLVPGADTGEIDPLCCSDRGDGRAADAQSAKEKQFATTVVGQRKRARADDTGTALHHYATV